jgi:serine protease Do
MLKAMTPMKYVSLFIISIVFKVAIVGAIIAPMNANAQNMPSSFADLADGLLPSVVNISTTQKVEEQPAAQMQPGMPNMPMFPEGSPFNDLFEDFFGQQMPNMRPMPHRNLPPATSLGSGFIIDAVNGYVITNNHVIANADEIKVTLHDDTILPAALVGSDDKTDIAVLKVDLDGQKVAAVNFGDSDVMRVGDWVLAIGNPFGLGGTVTAGIISARQRDINSGPYDDYLQTDASINRGNSGGPMFNMDGDVIGINTAIFSPTGGSVGIGFAIPSSLATSVIKQLIDFGRTKRGWLGVRIQTVNEDIAESLGLAKPAGALVAEVTAGGPAEKAGLQAGDVILVFDGKPVREMRQLPRIVAETDIDKATNVIVWRNGQRVTLDVQIGELEKAEDDGLLASNDTQSPGNDNEPKGEALDLLGLTVAPLNDQLRSTYGIDNTLKGLLIMDVDKNSDAAKKGIVQGDVIVDINQKTVETIDTATSILKKAKEDGREKVLLLINSQGNITFIAIQLETEEQEQKKAQ